jgi:hypothetical protein
MNISPIGTAPIPDPTSSVFTNIQRLFDILNLPPDRLGVSLNLVQFSALPPPVFKRNVTRWNDSKSYLYHSSQNVACLPQDYGLCRRRAYY